MVDNAKGILEFDREEHEKEFLCAVHGSDLVKIIWRPCGTTCTVCSGNSASILTIWSAKEGDERCG